jgi:tRNA pseudouridine55 synthase
LTALLAKGAWGILEPAAGPCLRTTAEPKTEELSGLLLIDKEPATTSHDLVNAIRRLAGQRKVGHIGTLDPLATGLMGLLLGSSTKLEPWLIRHDKVYLAEAQLGLITDTLDVDGRVLELRRGPMPTRGEIVKALASLEGESEQIPPAFSAIKVKGRAAYKAARAGEEVRLPPRRVTAHKLTLIEWRPPKVVFEASVSGGYYVRSLARDLGQRLNLGGGALSFLRRLSLGPFELKQAGPTPKDRLSLVKRIIEPRLALPHLKEIFLDEPQASRLSQGQKILAPVGLDAGEYKIIGPGGFFLALAALSFPSPDEPGEGPPRRPFLRPLRVFGDSSTSRP